MRDLDPRWGRTEGEATAPTKFGTYVLPGGENYREMLITLPGKDTGAEYSRRFKEIADRHGGVSGPELVRRWTPEESDELTRLARGVDQEQQARYKSPHWEEPNVVAHIRMNDRTGPNGEKILHVEEVQSDWHQKGRKHGYQTKPEPRYTVIDGQGMQRGDFETRAAAEAWMRNPPPWFLRGNAEVREVPGVPTGVPDAPFKTTWAELSMKRVLRYAAEHGYDKVTWTPGEKQAERYDLSKHLKSIEYEPTDEPGHYEIAAYDHAGNEVISEDEVSLDRIEALVGKEMAEKIRDDKGDLVTERPLRSWRRLSGLDLKVGGEGMRGFYDKILPAKVNALVKKWGAKVGETSIVHLSPEGEGWALVDHTGLAMHTGFASEESVRKFQALHGYGDLKIAPPAAQAG